MSVYDVSSLWLVSLWICDLSIVLGNKDNIYFEDFSLLMLWSLLKIPQIHRTHTNIVWCSSYLVIFQSVRYSFNIKLNLFIFLQVDLEIHKGFLGGLQQNKSTGDTAPYYATSTCEIVYHVSTRIPIGNEESRHIKVCSNLWYQMCDLPKLLLSLVASLWV